MLKIQFSERSVLFRIALRWVISPVYIGYIIIMISLALQLMISEKISFSIFIMSDICSPCLEELPDLIFNPLTTWGNQRFLAWQISKHIHCSLRVKSCHINNTFKLSHFLFQWTCDTQHSLWGSMYWFIKRSQ